VPPFTGVGVNVTLVPVQIVVAEAEIVTDGVTVGLIVIVLVLLVPLPHVLTGVTVTLPPEVAKVTVIEFVLAPEVIVAPVGSVQL